MHQRVDPRRAGIPQDRDLRHRQGVGLEDPGAQRVVDVVVDVGDPVDEPDDLALEGGRLAGAARVAQDAVPHRRREIELFDHPEELLVVPEPAPEALAAAGVEHRLADVAERRVAYVVPEPDRLRQVLVEPERPRDRARIWVASSVCVSRVR